MYVLVRRDLPPVQMAVQACHACLHAGPLAGDLVDPPHLVLCAVASLEDLQGWARRLTDLGVPFHLFLEPDLGNAPTALATIPVTDRRPFRALPLVRLEVSS